MLRGSSEEMHSYVDAMFNKGSILNWHNKAVRMHFSLTQLVYLERTHKSELTSLCRQALSNPAAPVTSLSIYAT